MKVALMRLSVCAWIFALVLGGSAAAADKPNILVVMTDDHAEEMITGRDASGRPFLPFIASKVSLARQFERSYYAQPLCCPSRVSMLTGRYPHNHGVRANTGANGGYDRYMANGLDAVSWPAILQTEYYTGMFGKFLNGYQRTARPGLPKGWDWWFALGRGTARPFNWKANLNGTTVSYSGATDAVYQTNVLAEQVVAAIGRKKEYKKPFAILFTPFSPHLPSRPALQFEGMYAAEPFAPASKPSFNEEDVTDKPGFLQSTGRLAAGRIAELAVEWRRMLESARSVDRAFQQIWQKLESDGQLANTFILFASDNGFSWGEHRITKKMMPYQESIKSTMYVWGPGVVPGVDPRIVSNIDFLPTFAEIAGMRVPDPVDGRSMLPLLRNETANWRTSFLTQGFPAEASDAGKRRGNDYRVLVTSDWVYIRYADEAEFYDLTADPFQTKNAVRSLDPEFVASVERRLDLLSRCSGSNCQPIEDAPLPVRTRE